MENSYKLWKLFTQQTFPWFYEIVITPMDIKFENLLKKVNDLYTRYGIRSVTMDDISRELGISKKTLYQYVKDKEDLVDKTMMYEFSSKRKFIEENKLRNAIEDIFFLNNMINRFIKESNPSKMYDLKKYYPAVFEKMAKLKRERTMNSMIQNYKKGKAEGLYRKEMDEEILAKMYILRMESVSHDDVVSISEFTSPKFIYEIFIYHIRGIASKKGIEFLENNLDKILPVE